MASSAPSAASSGAPSGPPVRKPRAVFSLGPLTKQLAATAITDEAARQPNPNHRKGDESNHSREGEIDSRKEATGASAAAATAPPIHAAASNLPAPSTSANIATAASPPSFRSSSSASSPSPSPSPPPSAGLSSPEARPSPGRGLVIDHARQAAIDAAFAGRLGFSPSSSSSAPRPIDLARVLECYNFPATFEAGDLSATFGSQVVATHLVDDGHLLVVFDRESSAHAALRTTATAGAASRSPAFQLRLLSDGSAESRRYASTLTSPPPPAVRPPTDSRVATRLLAGALGIRMPRMTPEQREQDRLKNEERKKQMAAAREQAKADQTKTSDTGDAWG